jgi:hypothetical protein
LHPDAWLRATLRKAVDPRSADDGARDLDLLVRSAARPGLHQRVAAYVARVAASRSPSTPSTAA